MAWMTMPMAEPKQMSMKLTRMKMGRSRLLMMLFFMFTLYPMEGRLSRVILSLFQIIWGRLEISPPILLIRIPN